jgi:hypothetical protein
MPVNAIRLVRKMRGGAQAHLLECDDGNFYIVKFRNNPQHRRTLVNEWVALSILQHLQISAPEKSLVNLSSEFLEGNPDVSLQFSNRCAPPLSGLHFGSRYPGKPDHTAVYDFLPDVLLPKVVNLSDFLGVLTFDQWVTNSDFRQAIFFRARGERCRAFAASNPGRIGFEVGMVDHGNAFGGPDWIFRDSPLRGLYFRKLVYQSVKSLDTFQPWLDRVMHFPESVVYEAIQQIPPEWLDGDKSALDALLYRLWARRRLVPDLILQCRSTDSGLFPAWSSSQPPSLGKSAGGEERSQFECPIAR